MKTRLSVYWNPVFGCHVIGSSIDGASEIAAWMSDDLPQGLESIELWIAKVKSLENYDGKDSDISAGNAHYVRVVGRSVFIECQFDDDMRVLLSTDQLLTALAGYRQFLLQDLGNKNSMPTPFDVEYEATGEDALDLYLKAGGKLGI